MISISRRRLLLAVATVTAVLALAAGVAFAVLPGGSVVEACVAAKSGAVRVVDSAGDCSSKESPLSFYSKSGAEAAFLGAADKAADAELLDGIDSSAFVRGGGQVIRERVSIAPGGDHTFSLPLASVKYTCPSTLSDPGTVAFRNTTSGFEQMWMDDSSSTQFEMFGVSPFSVSTTASGDHVAIGGVHLAPGSPSERVDVFSAHDVTGAITGSQVCVVFVHAVTS